MDIKAAFLNANLKKRSTRMYLLVLYQKDKRTKFVFLKDPSMVSSSLLEHGLLGSMKLLSLLA